MSDSKELKVKSRSDSKFIVHIQERAQKVKAWPEWKKSLLGVGETKKESGNKLDMK